MMNVLLRSLPAATCLIGLAASAALAQPPGPGGREGRFGGVMPPMPVIQALDTDGDGEISAREIENAAVALRTLDKDKNGKLTSDELRPAFGGRGPGGPGRPGGGMGNPEEIVTRMMAFDKNGDAKLAKDELPERMQVLIDRADANKDGFVDKAELAAYAAQQARPGAGPGPGAGRGRDGFGPPGGRGDGGPGPRGGGDDARKDQPRQP